MSRRADVRSAGDTEPEADGEGKDGDERKEEVVVVVVVVFGESAENHGLVGVLFLG
jgi:hypothetical protein